MTPKILVITALVGVAVLLALSWGHERADTKTEGAIELVTGSQITIPDGYRLVGVSAYGRFFGVSTFYIQQTESGRVYVFKSGAIGAEVVLPDGYELAGVSAYGEYTNTRTFYCRNQNTNEVFECKPE